MANHREIGSLLIIVDNRAGGKINEENRESPAEIGRVGMSEHIYLHHICNVLCALLPFVQLQKT